MGSRISVRARSVRFGRTVAGRLNISPAGTTGSSCAAIPATDSIPYPGLSPEVLGRVRAGRLPGLLICYSAEMSIRKPDTAQAFAMCLHAFACTLR